MKLREGYIKITEEMRKSLKIQNERTGISSKGFLERIQNCPEDISAGMFYAKKNGVGTVGPFLIGNSNLYHKIM